MKIKRYNEEETFKLEINPEIIQFAQWCLEYNEFFYDKDLKSWYDRKTLTPRTWDQVYLAYKADKYNI